jgi:hypothetical protein
MINSNSAARLQLLKNLSKYGLEGRLREELECLFLKEVYEALGGG